MKKVISAIKLIDVYILTLLEAGIAAVVLRTIALFTQYNASTSHYNDKVAITLSGALAVCGCLLLLTYIFLGEKKKIDLGFSENAGSYIPSGILSAALCFMAAERIMLLINPSNDRFFKNNTILHTIFIITAVLAILSVISFFLSVLIEKNENIIKALFSVTVVMYLAFYAAGLYFDTTVYPTNAPNKTVDQMAYLFASVFFLYETRITIGRSSERAYMAFGLIASLLTAYSAIPSLIYYVFEGKIVSASISETAITASLCLFITARVFMYKKRAVASRSQTAIAIEALAKMRDEELREKRERIHKNEENDSNKNVENEILDADNYTIELPPIEFVPSGEEAEGQFGITYGTNNEF